MAEERLREGTAAPRPHPCVTAITPGRTRGGTTRCAGGWSTWWITTAAGTGSSAWCARPLWPRWRSAPSRGTSIRCTPTLWSTALRKSSRWCWATTRQPCSWATRTTASCPRTTGRSSWLRSRHTLALRKGLSPVSPPCLKNNPPLLQSLTLSTQIFRISSKGHHLNWIKWTFHRKAQQMFANQLAMQTATCPNSSMQMTVKLRNLPDCN